MRFLKCMAFICVLVLSLLAVQNVAAATHRHSPQRNIPSSFRSSVWKISREGAGPTLRYSQHGVVIGFPARPIGETFKIHLQRKIALRGDFDARFHYRLLRWPPDNGVKLALGTEEGSVQRLDDLKEGGNVCLTDFREEGGTAGNTSVSDRSGTLRLVRRRKRLSGYLLRGGHWKLIHSTTLSTPGVVHVHVAAWGHAATFSGQPVRIAFDRFSLYRNWLR